MAQKKVSIVDIMDKEREDMTLYRDIFKFITPKIKEMLLSFSEIENKVDEMDSLSDKESFLSQIEKDTSPSSFRIRELVNWLLKNNSEFYNEYIGSPINKSGRAHSKTPVVAARINKLIELDLLAFKKDKVQSMRNSDIKTFLCDVTPRGIIVALTLDLENHYQGSEEYERMVGFLLKEWLNFIPVGYKDPYNYYYHHIEVVLEKCLKSHKDIILSFIDLIRKYSNGFEINFADLRRNINNIFFRKIVNNIEFRSLFYDHLNDLNVLKRPGISSIPGEQEEFITQKRQLLKTQFKLDIEYQIDRIWNSRLKYPPSHSNISQWTSSSEYFTDTSEELFDRYNFPNPQRENVIDFKLKITWEQMRNDNLFDVNKISLLVKCQKCFRINPILLEIEREKFEKIECRVCKTSNLIIL